MIKAYYLLTKPGIVLGNILTTAAGFLLAAGGVMNVSLFLMTILGLIGVIASGCIFNNYIDRQGDQKMQRTQNRGFVKGLVNIPIALIFALLLGIGGVALLVLYTNFLCTALAVAGFVVYVGIYSFMKYHSTYSTLLGSVAGALPPVAGYCAAGGHLDGGAFCLFTMMMLWQMPHFFAIAMYRLSDYQAASIPVLPVKKGVYQTQVHILLYIIAFSAALLLFPLLGYTTYLSLIVASLLGLCWLALGLKGWKSENSIRWARQMFFFSLVVIMGACICITASAILQKNTYLS